MLPTKNMNLLISYRDGSDEITERIISEIVAEPPNTIYAFCHLRNEMRTFLMSRIEQVVELNTGKVISDIWLYFGLPSLKRPPPTMPVFSERPCLMSTDKARQQHKADKQALFRRFKYPVIMETYKAKLYALFGHCCFRCNTLETLELDHHIPQYLGGRLVPGNIVILCSRCNMAKAEKHPKIFYTSDELGRLENILLAEINLFNFTFDARRWYNHPQQYLFSLGVTEEDVEHALHDREHPYFIGWNTEAKHEQ